MQQLSASKSRASAVGPPTAGRTSRSLTAPSTPAQIILGYRHCGFISRPACLDANGRLRVARAPAAHSTVEAPVSHPPAAEASTETGATSDSESDFSPGSRKSRPQRPRLGQQRPFEVSMYMSPPDIALTPEQHQTLWTVAVGPRFKMNNEVLTGQDQDELMRLSAAMNPPRFLALRFVSPLQGSNEAVLEAGCKVASSVRARLLSMAVGPAGQAYLLSTHDGPIEALLAMVPGVRAALLAERAAAREMRPRVTRQLTSESGAEGSVRTTRPRQTPEELAARAAALAQGKAEYARLVEAKRARQAAHLAQVTEAAAKRQAAIAAAAAAAPGPRHSFCAVSQPGWELSSDDLQLLFEHAPARLRSSSSDAGGQSTAGSGPGQGAAADVAAVSAAPASTVEDAFKLEGPRGLKQKLMTHPVVELQWKQPPASAMELVSEHVKQAGGMLIASAAQAGVELFLVAQGVLTQAGALEAAKAKQLINAASHESKAAKAERQLQHQLRAAEQLAAKLDSKHERAKKHQAWLEAARQKRTGAETSEPPAPAVLEPSNPAEATTV